MKCRATSTEKSSSRKLIVDTREESAAVAADSLALSTMAWNHCPRSLEYAATSVTGVETRPYGESRHWSTAQFQGLP